MDKQKLAADWALVTGLGGPAKVAEKLGWTKDGSVQRVQNWKVRGIPWKVKVMRPDLFLPNLVKAEAKRKQPQRATA